MAGQKVTQLLHHDWPKIIGVMLLTLLSGCERRVVGDVAVDPQRLACERAGFVAVPIINPDGTVSGFQCQQRLEMR